MNTFGRIGIFAVATVLAAGCTIELEPDDSNHNEYLDGFGPSDTTAPEQDPAGQDQPQQDPPEEDPTEEDPAAQDPPGQPTDGVCGGSVCGGNDFCDFDDGSCGSNPATGTCTDPLSVCTSPTYAVCGCDGNTYNGRCDARQAGVSVWATGQC
ncbi:hypothetical protein JYT28_00935 [Desulfobulbus sp. AH-315-M07]|nr:hypothetical protein [Desulfobulbus sp. AH-315-M07]